MTNNILARFGLKTLPQTFSIIFHPLLMPTYGALVLLFNSGLYISFMTDSSKNVLLSVIISSTFVLPLVSLPILYFRRLNQMFSDARQDRILPLVITSLFYYLGYYLMNLMGVPTILRVFILASFAAVCVTLLITFFWKISAHMIGTGGLCGLVFIIMWLYHVDLLFYLIITILISGVAAYSRLSLQAHTPKQIYTGWVIGFIVVSAIMLVSLS